MDQYVTKEYYVDTFKGTGIPNDDIEKYLGLAQEKIDDITFNRIVGIGFNNLTSFQQENIKKAICKQAEYYFENGINPLSSVSGYSVLDISVSVDNTSETEAQKNSMDEFALKYIKKTGLMGRSFRWH